MRNGTGIPTESASPWLYPAHRLAYELVSTCADCYPVVRKSRLIVVGSVQVDSIFDYEQRMKDAVAYFGFRVSFLRRSHPTLESPAHR